MRELRALPSCEVLEVARDGREELLVPLIRDAVRSVDVEARRIDVDLAFLGARTLMQIDVFTLFPEAFDWFRSQRHVANALAHGHALDCVNYRDTTPLTRRPGRRHAVRRRRRHGAARRRRGGGAARPLRRRPGRAAQRAGA